MLQECSQDQIIHHLANSQEPLALFVYTPFCGTCKLTENMLNIIVHSNDLAIVKSNINFMPLLTKQWHIQSVPCILIAQEGELLSVLYRINSIVDLWHYLLQNVGRK